MNEYISFFNLSLKKIISPELSIIDQARIKLLYYVLSIGMVAFLAVIIAEYLQPQPIFIRTSIVLLICTAALFKYLTYRPNWAVISHILLITATFVNLSNLFIILQTVNIITVQLIILIVIFSFYMLGQTTGLFYSLLNLAPVVLFLLLETNNTYVISFKPDRLDQSTLIISTITNFVLIIYIHNLFYGTMKLPLKRQKNHRMQNQSFFPLCRMRFVHH
jgi:hypothetical protein